MRITSVEYAGTIAQPRGKAPGALPQVAFSGRSNVGKSSLINTLLRRTRNKLAHVSSTPGKTRALNFYRVNEAFFLVDLPGYGYARAPAAMREQWTELIEWYLGESGLVRGVVHLVDARHRPSKHDHRMVEYLAEIGLPTLVVLTKTDKLKKRELDVSITRTLAELGLDDSQLVQFSSKTGEGREVLLEAMEDLVRPPKGSAKGSAKGSPKGSR
jgi:GTP-binding protein